MLLEVEALTILQGLTLGLGGFIVGCLAGLSGIGGGLLLVPMMVGLGSTPIQAIGTSNFTKLLISASGSWHSWRTGSLDLQQVAILGLPALICAQLGTYLASRLTPNLLWSAFAGLILLNVALIWWRRKLEKIEPRGGYQTSLTFERSLAGGATGILAGLFGVGGGIILVPLQIILLKETVEIAVQTSLGIVFSPPCLLASVIVSTAM